MEINILRSLSKQPPYNVSILDPTNFFMGPLLMPSEEKDIVKFKTNVMNREIKYKQIIDY